MIWSLFSILFSFTIFCFQFIHFFSRLTVSFSLIFVALVVNRIEVQRDRANLLTGDGDVLGQG